MRLSRSRPFWGAQKKSEKKQVGRLPRHPTKPLKFFGIRPRKFKTPRIPFHPLLYFYEKKEG